MSRAVPAPISVLPSALERWREITDRIDGSTPAVFLDYDGTLTPIVADPSQALLPPDTRQTLEELRSLCPVAVVSGRDLAEVRELVGVEGLFYGGSHGFDLLEPDGDRHRKGTEYLPALARCTRRLEVLLDGIGGAWIERKGFSVAVHYRGLENPADRSRVEEAVERVVREEHQLRKTGGKKVFELRPDTEWDKGRAILWMLEMVEDADGEILPVYLGDDVTDEDAFRVLEEEGGIGVVVRGEEDQRESTAEYSLADPDEVRSFLGRLADWLE